MKIEAGERAFYVDGKVLCVRDTLIIKDTEGNDRYKLKEKLLRIKDTMDILDAEGRTAATIKKALITPLRDPGLKLKYQMDLKWMSRAISCTTSTILKLEEERLQRSPKGGSE